MQESYQLSQLYVRHVLIYLSLSRNFLYKKHTIHGIDELEKHPIGPVNQQLGQHTKKNKIIIINK